ncbi:MAG: putative toxin-antitoxin system toxin component, PIN family [Bifidobacteriaceae bacterium]|jgi:putative PIN family toxin of toxin-antitoxin system|nr:putative toxin-antitoxin system toxin component, PIN family [Bifidobacteriaceae bacterium]
MPARTVLDTNILVSALLAPSGKPARVVDMVIAGEVSVCYDARILAEYREVLSRSKFPFRPSESSALIDQLRATGLPVIGASRISLPDPDDEPFAEVADWTGAWLVTGNLRHYPGLARAVSPEGFLVSWSTPQDGH